MKVKELIEKLQAFDPELDVEVGPDDNGHLSLYSSGIDRVTLALLDEDGTTELDDEYPEKGDYIVCIWPVK